MEFGKLEVNVGPMFAGKSESLVKEVLYASHFSTDPGAEILVMKPSYDSRYGPGRIVTHDGAAISAIAISGIPDMPARPVRQVFFDEVQFFTEPYFLGDFVAFVRTLRLRSIDVTCSGLDMDYLGRAFEVTAMLMAESTRINRLVARCAVCGGPATHTVKCGENLSRFELGAKGKYDAVCQRHWFAATYPQSASRDGEAA